MVMRDGGVMDVSNSGTDGSRRKCALVSLCSVIVIVVCVLVFVHRTGAQAVLLDGPPNTNPNINPYIGLGSSCGWQCWLRPGCNMASVACPACDQIGFTTCADWISVTYNPANVPIMLAIQPVVCTNKLLCPLPPVICSRLEFCVEGNSVLFSYCSGLDRATACVGTFPAPAWCNLCKKSTADDPIIAVVNNRFCKHDPDACPCPSIPGAWMEPAADRCASTPKNPPGLVGDG